MRWRLLIEEFVPGIIYLLEVNNFVANCLSRLKYKDDNNLTDHFALDKEDVNAYPLSNKLIMKCQQKDNKLLQKSKNDKKYSLRTFTTVGRTCTLIVKDDKIVIPLVLQEPVVHWYHKQLCHPGQIRTELTICQHFIWNKLFTTF